MSCESNSNKLARLVGQLHGGISHLASKGSFYTGVAVGATGTGLSLLLIARLRRLKPIEVQPTLIKVGPVAQTPTGRGKPPTPTSTRPGSRANPRKLTMGEVSAASPRNNPRKPSREGASGTRSNPKKLNMEGGGGRVQPLPVLPAKPLETKLETAATEILTGSGQRFSAKNSYRVVYPDGADTGLGVTPYLYEDEKGQPAEDMKAWGVTHTGTGALISGPYSAVSTAHQLATQLSTLRWSSASMPEAEVQKAKQIIAAYQACLVEK